MAKHTQQSLEDMTVAEIRDAAKAAGVEMIDARREADGKTPNKGHWIAALLAKQGAEAPKKAAPKKAAPKKAAPKKAQAAGPQKGVRTVRGASIENPRTGRPKTFAVREDGTLYPREVKATGLTQVDEWWTVEADSWAEGAKKIRAGDGQRHTRGGNGA